MRPAADGGAGDAAGGADGAHRAALVAAAVPMPVALVTPPTDPTAFLEHVRTLSNHNAEIRAITALDLARAQPAPKPGTAGPSPAQVRRAAQLRALEIWRDAASARLADLHAGRTGTGPGAQRIPESSRSESARLERHLITALSQNHARAAMLEAAQRRWHAAARSAREGIRTRTDLARERLGNPLRPDARLHLMLAHATFMVEGNSPRLRKELQDAATANPASKGLRYWLARYEVMVGHYPAAHAVATEASDYPPVRAILMPLLDPTSADAPWLSWPSNFYTYRYSLADDDELRSMQEALAALENNSEVVSTWLALGIPQNALDQLKARAISGGKAVACLLLWNQANRDFTNSKYAHAARNYEQCQRSIIDYFISRYPHLAVTPPDPPDESGSDPAPTHQLDNALQNLAAALINYNGPTREIWTFFRQRYQTLTLDELHDHDWRRPKVVPLAYEFAAPLPNYGSSTDFATALARLLTQMSILKSLQNYGEKVEEKLDAPLLALALVFCPMAIAEANRLRRNFDPALSQCNQLLRRHEQFKVLSEVVEKPFVKILKAQILLDKADAQYKARAMSAHPATNPDGSLRYQGLEAAETYQGVLTTFEDEGQYVNRVNAGVETMATEVQSLLQHTFSPIAVRDAQPAALPALTPADRRAFSLVGKKLTIETIVPRQGEFPEPDRRIRPHESLVRFAAPGGADGGVLAETNPLIYALILQARSRLQQMESQLNYLGYRDDYAPPWRFQFLLDRARYFAEHAKSAQREYLNFLENAEREEFQEQTAAQAVEMEKSNIRVETAKVSQVQAEVEAAQQSVELANLTAAHAQIRLANYQAFDDYADSLFGTQGPDPLEGLSELLDFVPGLNPVLSAVGDFFSGGAVSNRKQQLLADAQRGFEERNLALAISEADQAAQVGQAQLAVAQGGLLVAGMQRATAVLRHEFALQNLTFLRNRTLNAELWYRLSAELRRIADTYLRYGIEMAFLAEQAYEFEADKRIDVIRFDYDSSELGNMLAGDFLLADLDTIEQDLVVSQKLRQQQVRFVLSLSREYPAALQELRDTAGVTFSLLLEQIEKRFPGLFNVRIGSVEVLPVALMDNTRFSLELTHLGSGQVRLGTQSTDSTDVPASDWLVGLEPIWSIKVRSTPPETAIFSGFTRSDLIGPAAFVASNQRGAFEGLCGAGAWKIDFSARENRVVPGSLADVLITFTLTGYYDATLRDAVDHAPRLSLPGTTWFSGHENFPDAFYALSRGGRMDWNVTAGAFALQRPVGELQNVGVLLTPSRTRPELGRLMCSYAVELDVDAAGTVRMLRELPLLTFSVSQLVLDATLNTPPGTAVTFDFGDGTGLQDSSALPHTYARPGRYDVLIRFAANQRLTEYRAAVVVSRQLQVPPPCVAVPSVQATVNAGKIVLQPSLQAAGGETLGVRWQIDGVLADAGSGPVTFTVEPGRYVLRFTAIRPLQARFYSRQRNVPTSPIALDELHIATNRTFDLDTGVETTTQPNAFAQHVFGGATLSPIDRWTLELPLEENPSLRSVTPADTPQYDLSEVADAYLALEYRRPET